MIKTSRHLFHGEAIELKYSISGKGPSWVFLHGFFENKEMWKPFIPKTIRSICIDLPGHGGSDDIKRSYSLKEVATLIHEILVKEGYNKFNIVGHSMGAYVGLEVLNIVAEKVDSITIFQSSCRADNKETRTKRNRLIQAMKNGKEVEIAPSVRNLFAETFSEEDIIENQVQISKKTKWYGILNSTIAMRDRIDHFSLLKSYQGKIHYYIGKLDRVFDFNHSISEAEELGASIIEFDEASGHMAHLENPKRVALFVNSIFSVD